MKKTRSFTASVIAAAVLAAFLLQSTVLELIAIGSVKPDALMAIVVFLGMRLGPSPAAVTGFFAGLLQDLVTGFLGLSSISKSISGFVASFFAGLEVREKEQIAFPIALLTCTFIHNVIYFSLFTYGSQISLLNVIYDFAIPNALYTTAFGVLLYFVIPNHWLNRVKPVQKG